MRKGSFVLMMLMFVSVGGLVFGTGSLRSQTLEQIQPEPPPGSTGQNPGGPAGRRDSGAADIPDPETVRAAQEALQKKGFDPGQVNGVMDDKTRQAIQSFQEANGLKVTGELDAETVQILGIEQQQSAPGTQDPASRERGGAGTQEVPQGIQ